MTAHSIWLVCVALSLFFSLFRPMRPFFVVMAAFGLLHVAFQGTPFGALMFGLSATAAIIDLYELARAAIRGAR